MRRGLKSAVRVVAAVAVILAVAGNTFALPREDREQARYRGHAIVKIVKKVVRALGDGLTVPLP